MAVVERHILFSGCAATHDRRPVRDAMRGLARELHLCLQESPITACCGARTARDVGGPDARYLLAPLLTATAQGGDIVCFSPACRCALSGHLAALAHGDQRPDAGTPPSIPQVRDIVDLLAATDSGPGPLRALPRRLSFLQVALHGVCHGNHNPARWPGSVEPTEEAPGPRGALTGSGAGHGALADLVAATGAGILADVSEDCAAAAVPCSTRAGEAAHTAVACLVRAAEIGADALVTPCIICYTELQRHQRTLASEDRALVVRVLHLAQLLNLASTAGPLVWVYGAQKP